MNDSFQSINEAAERAIDAARKTQARRFLRRFRNLLKDTNLDRHQLRISAGMGTAGIWIQALDGHSAAELFDGMRCGRVTSYEARIHAYLLQPASEIQLIEEVLDPVWAYHLDGEYLNMARYRTPGGITVRTFGRNEPLMTYADGLVYRVVAELESDADFHKARATKHSQAVSMVHGALRGIMLTDRENGEQPHMEGLEVDALVKALRPAIRRQLDLV